MTEIGAYDAKTKLPELLRQVKKGKRFTITHRGEPVAELVPIHQGRADVKKAVADMLAFPRVTNVAPEEVAAWIAEGRR
jgi:prevent-host-death family protein